MQNVCICEGGRVGRLEVFHCWSSLSDIIAVTKIRKISWVLEQKYLRSFENWCWKKDGEDQLDRSCEKRSNAQGQGGEEYRTDGTTMEGQLGWSRVAQGMASKTWH